MLNISYGLFRWGMLASVIVSTVLKALLLFSPGVVPDINTQLDEQGMDVLSGVFEPSAVLQMGGYYW